MAIFTVPLCPPKMWIHRWLLGRDGNITRSSPFFTTPTHKRIRSAAEDAAEGAADHRLMPAITSQGASFHSGIMQHTRAPRKR